MNQFLEKIKSIIKNNDFLYVLIYKLRGYLYWYGNHLLDFRIEKRRFHQSTGYALDLDNPKSLNQKIEWKKIHDRNPLLSVTTDNFLVYSYIRDLLGKEKAENILIPLLHVTDEPETLPFDEFPSEYVIKANHGFGRNIFVLEEIPCDYMEKSLRDFSKDIFLNGNNFDSKQVISRCKKWLNMPYGVDKLEWAYQEIDRKIIVQKLLKNETGKVPNDFQFYIFHGTCKLVLITHDRFGDSTHSFFTPNFEPWSVYDSGYNGHPIPQIEKPAGFEEALKLAEELGRDFDFVRVDFYLLKDKIYFGEFTHYPVSGMAKLEPRSFDFRLGSYWKLTPEYWKK